MVLKFGKERGTNWPLSDGTYLHEYVLKTSLSLLVPRLKEKGFVSVIPNVAYQSYE